MKKYIWNEHVGVCIEKEDGEDYTYRALRSYTEGKTTKYTSKLRDRDAKLLESVIQQALDFIRDKKNPAPTPAPEPETTEPKGKPIARIKPVKMAFRDGKLVGPGTNW